MVGAVLANAHMAHEYFVNGPAGRPREHKAEFLRDMPRDIIFDERWRQKKCETSRRFARLVDGEKIPEAGDRLTVCEMKNLVRHQSGMPWARVSRRPPATNGISSISAPAQRNMVRHVANLSELFVHVVLSLCCARSTMLPIGQPVGILKNLVTLEF